jgi:hypothetical protein
MPRRFDAGFDFVCAGIGSALRTLHSDLLSEAIPDEMEELLRQLDPLPDGDCQMDNA